MQRKDIVADTHAGPTGQRLVHPAERHRRPLADLLEWLRGRFATEGLPGLDKLDDPLEFIDFEPWDDEAYW